VGEGFGTRGQKSRFAGPFTRWAFGSGFIAVWWRGVRLISSYLGGTWLCLLTDVTGMAAHGTGRRRFEVRMPICGAKRSPQTERGTYA
jgi:hypothetical protein